MTNIPEIINNFNVYKDGGKLIGVSAEVTMPDFEAMTETIGGAGLLGEYDAVNPGHYGAQDFEIPFRVLYGDLFKMMDPTASATLTLRGSVQTNDGAGNKVFSGMRIIVTGAPKKLTGGTLKAGAPMNAAVTLGLTYIKIEIDGKTAIELDKLNGIYKINDKDVIKSITSLC